MGEKYIAFSACLCEACEYRCHSKAKRGRSGQTKCTQRRGVPGCVQPCVCMCTLTPPHLGTAEERCLKIHQKCLKGDVKAFTLDAANHKGLVYEPKVVFSYVRLLD